MDAEILDLYLKLEECVYKDDWRKAFNSAFALLRKKFVFDNLAIYLLDQPESNPEVVYARAVGRGRSKEAEASWGSEVASQVFNTGKIVFSAPSVSGSDDRINMPYLLGLPLSQATGKGAMVFVRFGGPEYTEEQMPYAFLAVSLAARIFDRRSLSESLSQLELARHRAQLQDDFIATISHDLHTPLGFIKGYTTSLLRSDTIWDPATQREFLTIIDEESDHLVSLIDRILDSARLESGSMPMEYQPVRLDSLIRDVVMRVHSRHKEAAIDLDLEPAKPIEADTVRLTQVFDNLFENALKYASGSKINITLRVFPEKQIVTFADHGPGIPSEHLPFLFGRFYRVPGQSSQRGTGLGLFICKQIIQAHHGQISVKTSPGKGTAFMIELPTHL